MLSVSSYNPNEHWRLTFESTSKSRATKSHLWLICIAASISDGSW